MISTDANLEPCSEYLVLGIKAGIAGRAELGEASRGDPSRDGNKGLAGLVRCHRVTIPPQVRLPGRTQPEDMTSLRLATHLLNM